MLEESAVHQRAKQKLRRDMGHKMLDALNDPKTVEVMLNADGKLWCERVGEGMHCIGELRSAQGQAIIETVAGYLGKEVTRKKPLLEGELPLDGSRFAGQLPPIVTGPTFAIRKKAVAVFKLDEYVSNGIMSEHHASVIKQAVYDHRNIMIVGGTGSGKTTLVNAVINEMVDQDGGERVFIIEDTGEIQCAAANYVQYHTTIDVSMTMLLKTTLRMRPDRILVGEVRGPEALDLLMAWNTGHSGGCATVHANGTKDALDRLLTLVSMSDQAPRDIKPVIGRALDVIVHIERAPGGRRVSEVLSVSEYKDGQYQTEVL